MTNKAIRCRLSLHRWRVASSDDGSYRFRRCVRCRKEQDYDEPRFGFVDF
ncbi:hypothetical protein [Nocardioides coralli]|nr:hypothetical protein [Nocardioides coralli]QZY29955.1 hypothetical protein K6T13_04515 [Nocardioides coralli]